MPRPHDKQANTPYQQPSQATCRHAQVPACAGTVATVSCLAHLKWLDCPADPCVPVLQGTSTSTCAVLPLTPCPTSSLPPSRPSLLLQVRQLWPALKLSILACSHSPESSKLSFWVWGTALPNVIAATQSAFPAASGASALTLGPFAQQVRYIQSCTGCGDEVGRLGLLPRPLVLKAVYVRAQPWHWSYLLVITGPGQPCGGLAVHSACPCCMQSRLCVALRQARL